MALYSSGTVLRGEVDEVNGLTGFLKLGFQLTSPESPFSDEVRATYFQSIAKRPTLQDCLKQNLLASNQFDLEWGSISSLEEFEVCIFWLAKELNGADNFGYWLAASGFERILQGPSILPSGLMDQYDQYNPQPCYAYSTGWSTEDIQIDLPWYEIFFASGLGFRVEFCDDLPVSVETSITRK